MAAFYNEVDPYAAQWLRNLIAAGHIAPGVVDERSIEDIQPDELHAYTQCHFFAGIGGWSYALRLAGWPDDRPVWTGSCPCQPFSTAGKGGGFADERHLWPAWYHLIRERGPAVVLGEQVASGAAGEWLDLVQDDLEGMGYAFGAVPFPAAGLGAPHIRDRLYWVADSGGARLERCNPGALGYERAAVERGGGVGGLADLHGAGFGARCEGLQAVGYGAPAGADCRAGGLAQPQCRNPSESKGCGNGSGASNCTQAPSHLEVFGAIPTAQSAGPLHGLWADADWLFCRDGKWRPVEPGTFPLAHGAPARVGRLRAYGNAIVAPQAVEFIRAYQFAQLA